jgi:UV DNA damage endonuclease
MHPGQYTVLNSLRKEVVDNAIADLIYHTRVLTSMGLSPEHKIVLHIGGAYGDKVEASNRFVSTYRTLPQGVKERLIIENDDKLFTIGEVLAIAVEVGCPAVFDNLHHTINPSKEGLTAQQWIEVCATTWKPKDGRQKIHYAQQDPKKRPGSHSPTIALDDFLLFYEALPDKDIDIMLEVKDKNISALKCMHSTKGATKEQLQVQWLKYKPLVTERDPEKIWKVEDLLQDAQDGEELSIAFYRLLEKILSLEVYRSQAAITANTIADQCIQTPAEEKRITKRIAEYNQAQIPLEKLKQSIMNMAKKHSVDEVQSSYYPMM